MLYYTLSQCPKLYEQASKTSGQPLKLSYFKRTKHASRGSSKVTKWMEDFDDPSSRTSKRETWDEMDTKILEERFKEYKSLPKTTVIRDLLGKDDEMYVILNRGLDKDLYKDKKHLQKEKQKLSWWL